MKVFELSKKLKKSNKDLIAEIDDPRVKSHLSKVPEDILAEFDVEEKKIETEPEPTATVDKDEDAVVTVDSAETIVVEVKEEVVNEKVPKSTEETCPYSIEEIRMGCRCLGNKAPQWKWRHLIG